MLVPGQVLKEWKKRKCEWRVRGNWCIVSYVMFWCCCFDYVELNYVGLREGSYALNMGVCLS